MYPHDLEQIADAVCTKMNEPRNMVPMLDITGTVHSTLFRADQIRVVNVTRDNYNNAPQLVVNQLGYYTKTLTQAILYKDQIANWLFAVRSGTETSDLVIHIN